MKTIAASNLLITIRNDVRKDVMVNLCKWNIEITHRVRGSKQRVDNALPAVARF